MLLHLKGVLTPEELATARGLLADEALWLDGRTSAGAQASAVKRNEQLAQDSEAARRLQALVRAAVGRDPLFFSAALPRRLYNPLFNRYRPEAPAYGPHVDGAVLHSHADDTWVRTDLSCTLFLSDPQDYDGGELTIHDTYGTQRIKLPAGDAVLYPGTSLHKVNAVTRGARYASFFWTQSLVREDSQRALLFEMDGAIQQLTQDLPDHPSLIRLTGTYHNLLRRWVEV